MKKDAILSDCRMYRYALWRIWDDSLTQVLFICLNPSKADETIDDQTVSRCISFAKSWGLGSICMANLFAFRSREPEDMKAAADPIGPENDRWLKKLSATADLTVAAWGNKGDFLDRDQMVRSIFPDLTDLKLTKKGQPAHPSRLPASLAPISMRTKHKWK